MNTAYESTFIIIREDRAVDPKTIVSEGLRIGRHPDSDVWLNHPTVSRLHAGINKVEGYFYLINLSASSATTLNGRAIPFNEAEALTDGDEIQIGPFFLKIAQTVEALRIRVVLEFAVNVGKRAARHTSELLDEQLAARRRTRNLEQRPSEVVNALKVFWDKRTREKAGRPSPLHPKTPPRPGKIQFNWRPTRDLVRPWPFAIFVWALIVVGSFSAVAAFTYKIAFAPERISVSHTRTSFALSPAIAKRPNGGSCTSCHALGVGVTNKEKMNANCAECHQTESFAPTIIRAHRDAGIKCIDCHGEHRGEGFRPVEAALESCAKCHNDENKNLYNRKSVHTAHGGTYGYPVKNDEWIWSLDPEELAAKAEIGEFLKKNRVNSSEVQERGNVQFHGIHLDHVRVVEGVDGILDDDGVTRVLSCGSCHKTGYMGANVDRSFPRTTCARCHNARVFNEPLSSAAKDQAPSCTSCHVQHIKDTHWASSLRVVKAATPPSQIAK